MIKVYGIKNCGSVKKALNFLEERKIQYEFIDFKKTPPSQEELELWLKTIPLTTLCNSKGTTYKKLGLKDKNLSQEEIKDYLLKEPTLIKRPVISTPNETIVGFDLEKYEKMQW